jgi:glutamyl-Q tRNA(Asp) synthetase
LGHAYSAILAHDMAVAEGGTFLLRIEDIDRSRARNAWEEQIYDDLEWLGLWWPMPVMRQSERMGVYENALQTLWDRDLLYHCTCTRRDIQNALSAPQEGAPMGPDGLIYPGTCRDVPGTDHIPNDTTLRLNMSKAVDSLKALSFTETGPAHQGLQEFHSDTLLKSVGDIVLARKDMGTSYHLSVVLDDAAQGITDVVRGEDLFDATQIHVLLQNLLSLPTPTYHHHKLIRDNDGKRLAKRDDARAISKYRAEGYTPDNIRKMVGL